MSKVELNWLRESALFALALRLRVRVELVLVVLVGEKTAATSEVAFEAVLG
jgi:hypothetical protein